MAAYIIKMIYDLVLYELKNSSDLQYLSLQYLLSLFHYVLYLFLQLSPIFINSYI